MTPRERERREDANWGCVVTIAIIAFVLMIVVGISAVGDHDQQGCAAFSACE